MTGNNMNIHPSLISGLSGRVKGKLGTVTGQQYQGLISKLSISKGSYAEALKAELAKEAAMVEETQELLKEIAGLIENASAGFMALDRKWSKL